MITLNFYKDGAYFTGHDSQEICTLVSYAMWACIEDCIREDEDVYHYESAYDKKWRSLGFSYIKVNLKVPGHVTVFERFRENLSTWAGGKWREILTINKLNRKINWDSALIDAKKVAGLIKEA